jgi:hypothetical protein
VSLPENIEAPIPFTSAELMTFAVIRGYFPTVRVSLARLAATVRELERLQVGATDGR